MEPIDIEPAADNIGFVPDQEATRGGIRYDAVIATLVGLCALAVSSYTAYMQRQQVRAMVWPILEFGSSNDPEIHFTLANKGVGPAIIRHVIMKVDGQPVTTWHEAMDKLGVEKPIEPEKPRGSSSDMSGHVLSAGESMTIFTPFDPEGNPILFDKSNPLFVQMNDKRFRIEVEICYCSTLGDCWTVRGRGKTANVTTQSCRYPSPSAITFQQ